MIETIMDCTVRAAQPLQLLHFKFANFSAFPFAVGEVVASDFVTDKNNISWVFMICLGGEATTDSVAGEDSEKYMTGYIRYKGKELNDVGFHHSLSIIVRNALGHVAHENTYRQHNYNFGMTRSEILNKDNNILVKDTLHIDVIIQTSYSGNDLTFQPNFDALRNNMLRFLEDGTDADVTFAIQDTFFKAHRLILKINAPILASFCESDDIGSPILIDQTSPEVFRYILRYVYGLCVPEASTITKSGGRLGKELLVASDKYGIVGLKLAVETCLVESRFVGIHNVADVILFADAKTCPLLKEYAISYFVLRYLDVFRSESSAKLKQSSRLMEELIESVGRHVGCEDSEYYGSPESKMSIFELRKMLSEKGLDIDGSKEILVSRLESVMNESRDVRV